MLWIQLNAAWETGLWCNWIAKSRMHLSYGFLDTLDYMDLVASINWGTSLKKGMFFCWSSRQFSGVATLGLKGSRSGRAKPCFSLPIYLECRTCFELTGSRMDWYSARADCKFSSPHFSRHLPKTAASNIDIFVLLKPWGVVGWAASPTSTTLSQNICSNGFLSYMTLMKGSFVSLTIFTNSGTQIFSACSCIFLTISSCTLIVIELPCICFSHSCQSTQTKELLL